MFRSLLFGCLSATTSAAAQSISPSVINPAGGEAQVSAEVYEYAVGQLTPGRLASAGNIVITPEVLQPQVQSTGIIEQVSEHALRVFPNPASTILFLQPALQPETKLSYVLCDAAGKVIVRGETSLSRGTEQQSLPVEMLPPGIYNLKTSWIIGGNQYEAAFKVRKQQ